MKPIRVAIAAVVLLAWIMAGVAMSVWFIILLPAVIIALWWANAWCNEVMAILNDFFRV